MKHTTKKLLAILLVLMMAIGMMPVSVFTVGAEGTSNQGVQFVGGGNGEDALPSFTLDIEQIPVPTLSLKETNDETNGVLNFFTRISKTGYQDLIDEIAEGTMGNAALTFGTLIASQADVINKMNGELTHAAVEAAESVVVDDVTFGMVFNGEGDPFWYKEDTEFGYIVGSKTIADGDHATDYIAAGYAKLTIEDADEDKVYYAYAKNSNKTGTSLYELAIAALNDTSDERDADHKFQVDNDLYAAHTVNQRSEFLAFIQNVIEVTTDGGVTQVTYDTYNPVCNGIEVEISSYKKETDSGIWSALLAAMQMTGNDEIDSICVVSVTAEDGASLGGLSLVLDGMKVAGAPTQTYNETQCYMFEIPEYSPSH